MDFSIESWILSIKKHPKLGYGILLDKPFSPIKELLDERVYP